MNYIMLQVKLFNVEGDANEVKTNVMGALVNEFGDDHEHMDLEVEVVESA